MFVGTLADCLLCWVFFDLYVFEIYPLSQHKYFIADSKVGSLAVRTNLLLLVGIQLVGELIFRFVCVFSL